MKVQLKVISGSKAGQMITLSKKTFLIGRADDCDLKPRSELISRYHCAITSEEGYVAIRDMGSKNGVFQNGNRVTLEQELHNGDLLKIGPLEFEVVLSVALKGETKPKVGSVADVVNRVVEQSLTPAGKETAKNALPQNDDSGSGGDVSDWLLNETKDEDPDETKSFDRETAALMDELKKNSDEQKKKEEQKNEKTGPKGPEKQIGNTSDAAANLLRNFFKGNR